MDDAEALEFARAHVKTWNSHDLEAILALYSESVELVSPLALSIIGDAHVRGKKALRDYFAAGLKKYPDLQFELVHVFLCENSLTVIWYGPSKKLVAEVMFLGADRKIDKLFAHYICAPSEKYAS